ncbi:MAG: 1-deoxy-D-xylulose-5-phosphate reductoisomerase [Phycisphaerales bacterium]
MTQTDTRRLIILGSTGSIGAQTLAVVDHLNDLHARGALPTRYQILALAAGRNADTLTGQAARYDVPRLALADESVDTDLRCARGPDAAIELLHSLDLNPETDLIVSAMVGVAGLAPTLAALERGIDVALANKEPLVAAGDLVTQIARTNHAALLPIDSEHSAIWQCLVGARQDHDLVPPLDAPPAGVKRLILTASGGPFRDWPADRIAAATRDQALAHPTWDMGPKITIDCASLTNKALELIEAHHLFAMPASRLDVLVHPQSIIHSMVEMDDASTLAQLATTDMRTPIQLALTHPRRAPAPAPRLDLASIARLDFEAPDPERFPALACAKRVIERGGTSGAIFNAANEAAVEAFLADDSALPFGVIADLTIAALDELEPRPLRTLQDALDADAEAREFVSRRLVEA